VYIEDANVAIMIYPYKATQWWFALSDVKSYVDQSQYDELMCTLTERTSIWIKPVGNGEFGDIPCRRGSFRVVAHSLVIGSIAKEGLILLKDAGRVCTSCEDSTLYLSATSLET
jgi:hypothetical protein